MPLDLSWVRDARVNRSAVERRAATIPTRRSIKTAWQAGWLLRAITLMDLTTLQGDDTPGRVRRLCAKARQPVRLPSDLLGMRSACERSLARLTRRRGLRLPRLRGDGRRGAGRKRHSGGSRVDRISGRSLADEDAARGDRGVGGRWRRGNRHRHHAGARAHRQLAGALRRNPRLSRCLRLRASQDHPRHGRARHAQGCLAGVAGGDDGGRRLHQDEHRQGERQRDPAGRAS